MNRFVVVVSPESVIESAAEATADACALARLQASRHDLLARVPAWLDMSSQRFRFGENSDAGTRASVSYVGALLGGKGGPEDAKGAKKKRRRRSPARRLPMPGLEPESLG